MCHRKNNIFSKFHYNALKVFCHLQKVTVSFRSFCKSVSAKIFHLQRNSWKGFWQVLISVKVKIIKLNWVKLAEVMKKLDSSRTSINYIRLSKLVTMIVIFMTFCLKLCSSFILCFSKFKEASLKPSMSCSILVKYTLVNKDEIFTFSLYLIPLEFGNP